MKYHSVSHEHTIGAEGGKRYASRGRRSNGSRRPPPSSPTEPSRKPRDAAELLAKIDALYQELSLQPLPKTRRTEPPPRERKWPVGLSFIGILVIALAAGEVWLYFDRHTAVKRTPAAPVEALASAETGAASSAVSVVPPPALIEAPPLSAAPVPDMFDNLNMARVAAKRRAERKRHAEQEAALRAREAEEHARQARAEEAKRAEAQRVAAAQPRPPASPEELCADRGNFFSRNFCEARACQQPEWQNHPSCVHRNEERRRNQFPLSGGG